MKRRVMVFVSLLLLLCGCDRYADKRPAYDSHEKWVSEDPDLYFMGWDEEKDCAYGGQLKVKGKTIEIYIHHYHGDWLYVAEYLPYYFSCTNEDDLFAGECKFGKNKLKVTILPENDKLNLFGGEKKVITFIKETIPDENAEPAEEKTGKEKWDDLLEHIHNFWIDAPLSLE